VCVSFNLLGIRQDSLHAGSAHSNLLHAQVILRVAFLFATGRVKVAQKAFCWLLRKHWYSIPLLLMISLYLITVNLFVKSACTGVSHCWHVSPHAILWASGRRIGAEQMFPTRPVQKPSSVPTLVPARPSFGYQNNLPVVYLPTQKNVYLYPFPQSYPRPIFLLADSEQDVV
jgi:hypothetical protein